MKKRYLFIFAIFFALSFKAQTYQKAYQNAFDGIVRMLDGTSEPSFKEAVFLVENAYLLNQMNRQDFDENISFLKKLTLLIAASTDLDYTRSDRDQVLKSAALFSLFTDTIPILIGDNEYVYHTPYTYNFNDIWGQENWSNTFVVALLETKKGNCRSLPFLYKILADEIGVRAHIATAPHHYYIKQNSRGSGWYNVELTSGVFPIDAWLMASGYIHLDAVVNRLYMEPLNDTQMIALNLVDLARGYERRLGDLACLDFILNCTETALKYYPTFVNAMLLRVETKLRQLEILTKTLQEREIPPKELQDKFEEITYLYNQLHDLGYRQMPEGMYLQWMTSLREQRGRYENKQVTNK